MFLCWENWDRFSGTLRTECSFSWSYHGKDLLMSLSSKENISEVKEKG